MNDLINREYLVEHIHACMGNDRLMQTATKEDILKMIADTPSARPIGKWELLESEHVENVYLCSNCRNYEAWGETEKTPFCPHCGAWMEV